MSILSSYLMATFVVWLKWRVLRLHASTVCSAHPWSSNLGVTELLQRNTVCCSVYEVASVCLSPAARARVWGSRCLPCYLCIMRHGLLVCVFACVRGSVFVCVCVCASWPTAWWYVNSCTWIQASEGCDQGFECLSLSLSRSLPSGEVCKMAPQWAHIHMRAHLWY